MDKYTHEIRMQFTKKEIEKFQKIQEFENQENIPIKKFIHNILNDCIIEYFEKYGL